VSRMGGPSWSGSAGLGFYQAGGLRFPSRRSIFRTGPPRIPSFKLAAAHAFAFSSHFHRPTFLRAWRQRRTPAPPGRSDWDIHDAEWISSSAALVHRTLSVSYVLRLHWRSPMVPFVFAPQPVRTYKLEPLFAIRLLLPFSAKLAA
jgi:hypothetical protein